MFYIHRFLSGGLQWKSLISSRGLWNSFSLRHQHKEQNTMENQGQKIFELRTYTVDPAKFQEFLAFSADHLHIRVAYSKLIGYWKAEISGLNQVVHIWEFDSLAHRANVRSQLSANPVWVSHYLPRVDAMFQKMENSIMELVPGTEVDIPTGRGLYELQTLKLQGHPSTWSRHLIDYARACKGIGSEASLLIGAWQTAIGPRQVATLLWQHEKPDSCLSLRHLISSLDESKQLSSHVVGGQNRILLPHPISPLQ